MGIQSRKGVETHNYRAPREHSIAMTSWTVTYRFYVMEHGGVDPDEVEYWGIPNLQHSQVRRDPRKF